MFEPMRDYVIIEPSKPSEISDGGVLLPKSKERPKEGVVVAVGRGMVNKVGEIVPMTVKVGDKVVFNYGGTDIEYRGKKYRITREDDILALVID